MKKKTYVFDSSTLELLESLKKELGKKEVQILREALRVYGEKVQSLKESVSHMGSVVSKMDMVLVNMFELSSKIEDVNAKLRRIERLLSKE